MRENSNYRPDWNLNMTWAKNCAEACTWFMDKLKEAGMKEGADFTPKTLGHYEFSEGTAVTTMVDVKGGMVFPIRALCEYCESLFDVWYDTPAVQLVKEGGKVVGCYARNKDGEVVRFNAARGVVLATGDYQNNAAMVDKYCPDAAYFDKKQSGKTGDGHLMGMMAGAKMQPINHTKMIHAKNWGTNSTLMGSVPLFAVNMNGDRFCAEDVTFSLRCNIVKNQPEQAWINIMDSNYVVQLAEMGVSATSIEDFEASGEDNGNYKADTLEELAGKLGIPADHLIVSVDRYNELCELGYDADFGKEAKYLHTIKEAPFYAMHKEYAVSALTSGLIINSDAQVLDNDGNVIDGLYAVGNCSGSFYAAIDYPMAIAGLSLSRCITFGYLVGKKLG
jgi:succinate dehydrogenase/fumarate reductase flavoprotein subunit